MLQSTLFNESYQASGVITRQRFVTLDGDQKVRRSDALGQRALGVAVMDISADEAARGKSTAVMTLGIAYVEAGAAIARDAMVTTDATGRAVTAAGGNAIMGRARKAAGGAGELVPVFLSGGFGTA